MYPQRGVGSLIILITTIPLPRPHKPHKTFGIARTDGFGDLFGGGGLVIRWRDNQKNKRHDEKGKSGSFQ